MGAVRYDQELLVVIPEAPKPFSRTAGKARRYSPPEYEAYKAAIGWGLKDARMKWERESRKAWNLKEPRLVQALFLLADGTPWGRVGDVDNYVKAVLDAGTGILWEDDKQLDDVREVRRFSKKAPQVVVSVGLALDI